MKNKELEEQIKNLVEAISGSKLKLVDVETGVAYKDDQGHILHETTRMAVWVPPFSVKLRFNLGNEVVGK